MKTILEFLDGGIEVLEDQCPVFQLEEADDSDQFGPNVYGVDASMISMGDEVPLKLLKRVVFEP